MVTLAYCKNNLFLNSLTYRKNRFSSSNLQVARPQYTTITTNESSVTSINSLNRNQVFTASTEPPADEGTSSTAARSNNLSPTTNSERTSLLLNKLANGESLSVSETQEISLIPLDELANFSMKNGSDNTTGRFNCEKGSIVRVTLFLRDTKIVSPPRRSMILNSNDNFIQNFDKELLNYDTSSVKLFFIVVSNDNSLDWYGIIQEIEDKLFSTYVSWFYSNRIFLEAVSICKTYPFVDKYKQRTLTSGKHGRLNDAGNEPSKRPFVYTLVSDFVYGGRNNYTIRFPKVSNQYGSANNSAFSFGQETISKLGNLLEQPFVLGDQKQVVLKLAFKTNKVGTPLTYVPVSKVVPLGLLGPTKAHHGLADPLKNSIDSQNNRSSFVDTSRSSSRSPNNYGSERRGRGLGDNGEIIEASFQDYDDLDPEDIREALDEFPTSSSGESSMRSNAETQRRDPASPATGPVTTSETPRRARGRPRGSRNNPAGLRLRRSASPTMNVGNSEAVDEEFIIRKKVALVMKPY